MKGKNTLNPIKRYIIGLSVLCVALNGTQAVVLCAGCDGHVAVEMAGHHHCHNANDCQATSHNSNHDPDSHDTPCRLCVDIPLSPGISDRPVVRTASTMNAWSAGIALAIPDAPDHGPQAYLTAGAWPAFTSFHDPLHSIILIV